MCSHGLSGIARFALGPSRPPAATTVPAGVAGRRFQRTTGLTRVVVPLDGSTLAEAALTAVRCTGAFVVHEVTLLG